MLRWLAYFGEDVQFFSSLTIGGAMAEGFYSLVQHQPDLERAEGTNIGLVSCVPALRYARVRMKPSADPRLALWQQGITSRMLGEAFSWKTSADLARFAATESSCLVVLAPRKFFTDTPEDDTRELFERLVG